MCTISRVRAANERGQRLEKPGNSLGGHTMATAPFGRARSVASCQCLGHITRWAYSDSRRYRKKIRTIWRRHDGDCAFWWGESVASCQCLGHITPWACSDHRPYRKKIRTIWQTHEADCPFYLTDSTPPSPY